MDKSLQNDHFDHFALSDLGGRSENQDAWAAFEFGDGPHHPHGGHGWIVADGLGGHQGGEVASRIAVASIGKYISQYFRAQPPSSGSEPPEPPEPAGLCGPVLDNALRSAQSAILAAQAEQPQLSRMRTTVVVLASHGCIARWAHMGDSRLYHFRGGRLIAQTADHSVPYMLHLAGEIPLSAIRTHEDRNRLLRALGSDPGPEGEWRPGILAEPITLEPRDAFLLCSDGFWEHVLEEDMATDLSTTATARDWVHRMAARLRAKVGAAGRHDHDHDNYTALAVRMCAGK